MLFGEDLTLSQTTKFWTGPNSKQLQTTKLDVAKMTISLFDREENTVGKGENAGYQHFLLFPHCFPKPSSLTHSHTMPPLTPLGNEPYEITAGKGQIARNNQFLLFPQCFLPVLITFFHFRQI